MSPAKPARTRTRPRQTLASQLKTVKKGYFAAPHRAQLEAHATIGRILMALFEVLDMTDKDRVQRILLELVPPSLASSEVPPLCAALRTAGAAALADHIHAAFDMGGLEP